MVDTYEPKYVSRDDIPITVPDDYSENEKSNALRYAESKIELDINNGNTISAGSLREPHIVAVQYLATCQLTLGAEHPDDMAVADLTDDGSTKRDYSNEFCEKYEEIVDSLISSGVEDGSQGGSPYHYITSEPDRHDDSPYF